MRLADRLLGRGASTLVTLYQLGPGRLLAGRCKFYPSCSEYARLALREQGLARGLLLTSWRLLRCNPWSHGGVDWPAANTQSMRGSAE